MQQLYIKNICKTVIITIFALSVFSIKANAQSDYYRAFKVDAGFGYGSGTAAVTLEPHYRITDIQAVGLRYQLAIANEGNANTDYTYTSYCLTFDQYFAGQKSYGDARFFGGVGGGVFAKNDTHNNITKNSWGFFPRLGLEAGHFRTAVDYNFTGNNFNYLQISVGFFIGGGKK